jgi:hypothetical protein
LKWLTDGARDQGGSVSFRVIERWHADRLGVGKAVLSDLVELLQRRGLPRGTRRGREPGSRALFM